MKKILIYISLLVLLLTGCSSEVDVVQKYKEVLKEVSEKEVYHTREQNVWIMAYGLDVKQEREIYYSNGDLYHSVVQNDTSITNVVRVGDVAHLNRISNGKDLGWQALETPEDVQGFMPWIVKMSNVDSRNDVYISYEETEEGFVVIYDGTEEIPEDAAGYHVTVEKYYFDSQWNLLKVESTAKATYIGENGEVLEEYINSTIEFLDTSTQEIEKKIEDAFSQVK